MSYDEVLRFRKSAAKYVGDNAATLHRMMGFTQTDGLVFGWYDNFDLLVSTPNGRRETHAMATEFQIHPAGIINGNTQPGISTVIIPRLTSKQAKSVGKNRATPLIHCTGPKKVIPPAVPTANGISYNEVCSTNKSGGCSREGYAVAQQPGKKIWSGKASTTSYLGARASANLQASICSVLSLTHHPLTLIPSSQHSHTCRGH